MRHARRGWFALAACAALGSGCGRAHITTEVRPDGTWTRKMEFRAPAPKGNVNGVSVEPKLEDLFGYPTAAPWTVTRTKTKDEIVVTAERTLRAGEVSQPGALIKGKDNKTPLVTDVVTVQQVGPGKWEYRETLHWAGDRPKDFDVDPVEVDRVFQGGLPPGLATPADIKDLEKVIVRAFWRLLFGPGDPLMSQLLLHPDLAEHRAMRQMGMVINRALQEKFGDRLSSEARLNAARRIVRTMMESTQAKSTAKADPQAATDNSGAGAMAALGFSVKLPGKIVATNGEADELTGEVYWALYAIAPALEDVTLTATCDVGKTTAAR